MEMSGNSAWSRRQTAPIVSGRESLSFSSRSTSDVIVAISLPRKEGQPILADLQFVPTLEPERLPRPAAARAHNERRTLDAKVGQRDRVVLGELLRREGHRRVRARLIVDQQRPALGAVVGRFRILETALGTVDVTHTVGGWMRGVSPLIGNRTRDSGRNSSPAAQSAGGSAFEARISASLSTSTSCNGLLPSPTSCFRRDCSSARSMSILPCKIRRS